MSKETIGPRIKAFRKGRGITQAELAKSLGYSHKSVITHIEKGESEMSYEKILLLLRSYDADANELFDVQHIDKLLEEHDRFKKEEVRKNAWMKDSKDISTSTICFRFISGNRTRKFCDKWQNSSMTTKISCSPMPKRCRYSIGGPP